MKLLASICFLFIFGNLSGQIAQTKQNKVRLLCYYESKINYMAPYIENKLRNISYAKTNDPMFSSVTSLNNVYEEIKTEAIIVSDLFDFSLDSTKLINGEKEKKNQKIIDLIRNSGQVLKIKINSFNNQLEYQALND